jgi:hypothetical protein
MDGIPTSSPPPERGPWPVSALRWVRRRLRGASWPLADFGWVWIGYPPLGALPSLSGPPPGHPERVSGAPLTPQERALERQLRN